MKTNGFHKQLCSSFVCSYKGTNHYITITLCNKTVASKTRTQLEDFSDLFDSCWDFCDVFCFWLSEKKNSIDNAVINSTEIKIFTTE